MLERARPVPVILVTGYADLYAKQLATAPFAQVLRKPVDPWQIVHGDRCGAGHGLTVPTIGTARRRGTIWDKGFTLSSPIPGA